MLETGLETLQPLQLWSRIVTSSSYFETLLKIEGWKYTDVEIDTGVFEIEINAGGSNTKQAKEERRGIGSRRVFCGGYLTKLRNESATDPAYDII